MRETTRAFRAAFAAVPATIGTGEPDRPDRTPPIDVGCPWSKAISARHI